MINYHRMRAVLPPLLLLLFSLSESVPVPCSCHLTANLAFGAGTLAYPTGIAVDPTSNALFVADTNNHRVLRFDHRNALTSASTPSFAFGQPSLSGTGLSNWDSASSQASARGLNTPTGIPYEFYRTFINLLAPRLAEMFSSIMEGAAITRSCFGC